MFFRRLFRFTGLTAGLGIAGYFFVLRPWAQRSSATDDETRRPLPGDELVADPKETVTYAVTIAAPAAKIWPWLVQMGGKRAGWYSYDRFTNKGEKSANHILSDLQHLAVGDILSATAEEKEGFFVAFTDENKALVLDMLVDFDERRPVNPTAPREEELEMFFRTSWAFVLDEIDENTTRMLVRNRIDYAPPSFFTPVYRFLFRPAHFAVQREQLVGIKRRAESTV